MKTSNLIGLLAIGGIGYYLLKNKNKPVVPIMPIQERGIDVMDATDTPTENTITQNTTVEKPVAFPIGTPIKYERDATNSISIGGYSLPIPIARPTTEELIKTLFPNAKPSIDLEDTINKEQLAIDINQTNCEVSSDGWQDNLVENFANNGGKDIRNLILNYNLKDDGIYYIDNCGNIVMKPAKYTIADFASKKEDGFYVENFYRNDKTIYKSQKYYVKNRKAIVIPSGLLQKYRNKYLVPYRAYVKNLPMYNIALATPSLTGKINRLNGEVIEAVYNTRGEELFKSPEGGVWKYEPSGLNSSYGIGALEGFMTDPNMNKDSKALILNPRLRNKGNMYIDQFGNLIQNPSLQNPNGAVMFPYYMIAEYRVKNNIPF